MRFGMKQVQWTQMLKRRRLFCPVFKGVQYRYSRAAVLYQQGSYAVM